MRILLSNDDGVYAEGLAELARVMSEIAEIIIVAPDRNRTGASNSLTLEAPLRIKYLQKNIISVEGTPTDCVHLALTGILDELPDMVISGINAGANLGDDVWYSGTVAAATEGRFLGFPSIAVSLAGTKHYDTAAQMTKKVVERIIRYPLPPHTILNMNVPDLPIEEIKGFEVTRLGTRHIAEPTLKSQDPRGLPIFWIGPAGPEQDSGEGTDFHAINAKKVAISPLRVDLTHHEVIHELARWFDGFKDDHRSA
jgi:5'-nucleotidase